MPVDLGVSEWLMIITHIKKWVTNLLRAKSERKEQSKKALGAVIKAVRKTTFYLRALRETGKKDIKNEEKLSMLWTELSLNLKDKKINLISLGDRCNTLGKYWADPAEFSKEFLNNDEIRIRLSQIEELADTSLKQI